MSDPPARRPDIAALYSAHRDAMARCAAGRLRAAGRSTDEVSDVLQEAFRSLMAHFPDHEVDNWEAYLITITIRRAQDMIDSAHARRSTPGRDQDVAEDLADQNDRSDADVAEQAAGNVDRERQRRHVTAMLPQLPEREREALQARVFHGRPVQRVATEMGISAARVSQLVTRATERLTSLIAAESPPGEEVNTS